MAITTTGKMDTITAEKHPGSSLLRLMAWLSPAFPVGSFSYSHGLEKAVEDGLVDGQAELAGWIEALIRNGSGWNDAVLFAESWRLAREGGDLRDTAELAEALAGSRERHMESLLQGAAFLNAAAGWTGDAGPALPEDCAYCVAVGALSGSQGIPLADALTAFLLAFASNLVQAGIRLGVIGQQGAVSILASLEPALLEVAASAERSTAEDLGACTVASDVMAMRHETQYSRLFRS